MKLFLDTANLEDIRAAARLGVIHGVTTNPTLISREKGDFSAIIREIASLVDGPVFAEVLSSGAEGMIREGRELAGVDPAVCVNPDNLPSLLTALSCGFVREARETLPNGEEILRLRLRMIE